MWIPQCKQSWHCWFSNASENECKHISWWWFDYRWTGWFIKSAIRRWGWVVDQARLSFLWLHFQNPSTLRKASTCPQREEEKKARRREENQEGKKCATAVEICQPGEFYAAPRGGSHREPCHRVADRDRPANTHLFDRCKHLCWLHEVWVQSC